MESVRYIVYVCELWSLALTIVCKRAANNVHVYMASINNVIFGFRHYRDMSRVSMTAETVSCFN